MELCPEGGRTGWCCRHPQWKRLMSMSSLWSSGPWGAQSKHLTLLISSYLFALGLWPAFPWGWVQREKGEGANDEVGSVPFLCLLPPPPLSGGGAACLRHPRGGRDPAGTAHEGPPN